MKKNIGVIIIFLFSVTRCVGQPNCNIYKWKGDSACYHACLEATKAIEFDQGSRESQIHFNKSIELCQEIDYAYSEKAVPYLKRGEFIEWKKLIDRAVEINPAKNLGYRGWCRYQFLRDYEGAIKDIERLDSLANYDIGYSVNADYHLIVAKALCYEGLGENKKAIEIIEKQLSLSNYTPSAYDYLHLGILKLKTGDYLASITALKKELEINDYLADTYYYLAIAHKKSLSKEKYEKSILKAKEYYEKGKRRTDPYTETMDKIYLVVIETEIQSGW
jgi:tetratricopeptide (TPR) repeat protein